MSRLKKTLGEDFADRMEDRRGLKKVRVAGRHEEAVTGPTATRALQALGARAMTLDDSIILPEDFDESDPEQAALYAHEAFHVNEGTGLEAAHHIHDAEEAGARAVEQMVFHEMSAGGEDAGAVIHRSMEQRASGGEGAGSETGNIRPGESMDTPEAVYSALLGQGMTHDDIVHLLAESVMQSMDEQRDEAPVRNPLTDPGNFNF